MRYPKKDRKELAEEVVRFVDFQRNYRNPHLNMYVVADSLGIARSTLIDVMKVGMGMPFLTYLDQCRLNHAQQMLESPDHDLSVEDISVLCGFMTKRTFYAKYKKRYGCLSKRNKKVFS